MDKEQFEIIFRMEESHWWYLGMQQIVDSLLARHLEKGRVSRILDAGCGTGGMLKHLRQFGPTVGIDLAEDALDFCRRRQLPSLVRGSVEQLPFAGESFDLVVSFDVLYHQAVGNDLLALAELNRVLRPEGLLVIRVPAYDWLRGAHDVSVHTGHRYHRSELAGKLRTAGFRVRELTYVNFLLFPIAALKRMVEGTSPALRPDLDLPSPWVNRALLKLLALESTLLRFVSLPWGLSVLAVADKLPGSSRGSALDTEI